MQKSINYLAFFVVLLAGLAGVSSDLYLPSLPAIVHEFHTPISMVQLTVAIFLLGYSLARLSIAIASDASGRKPPLILSLVVCLLGCLLSLFAPNIYVLLLGRLLQGYGAGGANILGRLILRDSVPKNSLAKYFSYFSMVRSSSIMMAPLLGGYIEEYLGWRIGFMFLLIYTVIMLFLALFYIPETNQFKSRKHLQLKILKTNIVTIFSNSTFVISVLSLFFCFAVFMAWLTTGPIILQKIIGISPITFGWCAALVGFSYFSAAYMNSKIVNRFGINKMRMLGSSIIFLAGVLMLIPILVFNYMSTVVIVVPAMLALFGCGLAIPNSIASGLLPFTKIAGIATALLGTIQTLGGVTASTIISLIREHNQSPLGMVIIIAGMICILLMTLTVKYFNKTDYG